MTDKTNKRKEKPTGEDAWWPYQILLCRPDCRQEGILRFRLKRDRDVAAEHFESLGFHPALIDRLKFNP